MSDHPCQLLAGKRKIWRQFDIQWQYIMILMITCHLQRQCWRCGARIRPPSVFLCDIFIFYCQQETTEVICPSWSSFVNQQLVWCSTHFVLQWLGILTSYRTTQQNHFSWHRLLVIDKSPQGTQRILNYHIINQIFNQIFSPVEYVMKLTENVEASEVLHPDSDSDLNIFDLPKKPAKIPKKVEW